MHVSRWPEPDLVALLLRSMRAPFVHYSTSKSCVLSLSRRGRFHRTAFRGSNDHVRLWLACVMPNRVIIGHFLSRKSFLVRTRTSRRDGPDSWLLQPEILAARILEFPSSSSHSSILQLQTRLRRSSLLDRINKHTPRKRRSLNRLLNHLLQLSTRLSLHPHLRNLVP